MDKINNYRFKATLLTFILLAFGIYMVYDASNVFAEYYYNDEFYYFKRQLIYALIGGILFFVGYKVKISFFAKYLKILLAISFILLILTLIPGIGIKRGGSSSWLGFDYVSFQPSEFFKLTIILYFATFLNKNYKESIKIKTFIKPFTILFLGILLIMLQPDFGSSMVILFSLMMMLFTSRLKIKYFVFCIFMFLIFIVVLIVIAPYRLTRITSFLSPFDDPLGSGFQIIQSLFSISKGGLIGLGENSSIQKYFYLPEPQTDFIFAIVVESFGFIGGSLLIILYALLFYYYLRIILSSKNLTHLYFSLGILFLFLIQVLINLGVVTSVLPVTGITLPLISYGGSSLCILLFGLGMIVNKKGDISEK